MPPTYAFAIVKVRHDWMISIYHNAYQPTCQFKLRLMFEVIQLDHIYTTLNKLLDVVLIVSEYENRVCPFTHTLHQIDKRNQLHVTVPISNLRTHYETEQTINLSILYVTITHGSGNNKNHNTYK